MVLACQWHDIRIDGPAPLKLADLLLSRRKRQGLGMSLQCK
jgi:hypothetical protein